LVEFMAQHFLLSSAARSLSPAKVMRISEQGAQTSLPGCAGRTQMANPYAQAVDARSATTAAAGPINRAGAASRAVPISR
jgi:hypothetical protein